MIYSSYTDKYHEKIGLEINNKDIVKNKNGDITYITEDDLINFCCKYSDIDSNLIIDILKIWSYESKIKFYYYCNNTNDDDIFFCCHEWYKIKPVIYLILLKIDYFIKN